MARLFRITLSGVSRIVDLYRGFQGPVPTSGYNYTPYDTGGYGDGPVSDAGYGLTAYGTSNYGS